MSDLTPKQTLFVHEYLKDLNATQAAIRAGYSEKTARFIGNENLAKPYIKSEIDKALNARIEETKIDANWVLQRLAEEVKADLGELYDEDGNFKPIKEWPLIWRQGLVSGMDITTLAGDENQIAKVTKLKLSDRVKRLELLGRHINVQAFATKVEHTGPNGGPIEIETVDDIEMARRVAFILTNGAGHAIN